MEEREIGDDQFFKDGVADAGGVLRVSQVERLAHRRERWVLVIAF